MIEFGLARLHAGETEHTCSRQEFAGIAIFTHNHLTPPEKGSLRVYGFFLLAA